MTEIQVVFPQGAFGSYEGEEPITSMLRHIAVSVSPDPKDDWAEKYGTDIENDVFLMHQFCWCDKEGCPWCAECDCPESAWRFFVDGKEVTREEHADFYFKYVFGMTEKAYLATPAWMLDFRPDQRQKRAEANARREVRQDPVCAFCATGAAPGKGSVPGKPAPNFWHKPSGLKVWWYKYIGRSEEYEGLTDDLDLKAIAEECIASAKQEAQP